MIKQIVTYCSKSFSCNDLIAEASDDTSIEAEVSDSDNYNNKEDYVISNIKNYAKDILLIERDAKELIDTKNSKNEQKRCGFNEMNKIK